MHTAKIVVKGTPRELFTLIGNQIPMFNEWSRNPNGRRLKVSNGQLVLSRTEGYTPKQLSLENKSWLN